MTSLIQNVRFRLLAVASVAWLMCPALPVKPAHAFFRTYNEAWCANMGDNINDCSYFTWEQCRAAASGTGNFCFPNPRYTAPVEPRKSKRRTYRN